MIRRCARPLGTRWRWLDVKICALEPEPKSQHQHRVNKHADGNGLHAACRDDPEAVGELDPHAVSGIIHNSTRHPWRVGATSACRLRQSLGPCGRSASRKRDRRAPLLRAASTARRIRSDRCREGAAPGSEGLVRMGLPPRQIPGGRHLIMPPCDRAGRGHLSGPSSIWPAGTPYFPSCRPVAG